MHLNVEASTIRLLTCRDSGRSREVRVIIGRDAPRVDGAEAHDAHVGPVLLGRVDLILRAVAIGAATAVTVLALAIDTLGLRLDEGGGNLGGAILTTVKIVIMFPCLCQGWWSVPNISSLSCKDSSP